MLNVLRVTTLRVSCIAGILSVAVGAVAQPTAPVIYQGLPHTAIGQAVLQVDTNRNTLDVHTADPSGQDGVAVDLGGKATSWTARLGTPDDPGLPLVMTWHAIADGQRISSAFLRQVDDRFALSVRFTGAPSSTSTYAVQVYDRGKLVGALGGLPPTAEVHVPHWLPCEFLEHGCSWIQRFHNDANGACAWGSAYPNRGPFTLPNGVQLVGDEVRMVEEVRAAGHYPYLTFDGITMQTNARVLMLFSETSR